MPSKTQSHYSVTFLLKELLFDVAMFPVWWYSSGLKKVAQFWLRGVLKHAEQLSLKIWLKNMFTPMYGDYTKSGKAISFFLRIIVLFYRTVALIIWVAVFSVFVILWALLPPIVAYAIVRQFN
ncbi:MAG: hypothetical protein V1853_01700 [bacterium]